MAILAWLPAGEARAANGAYAVDAADIGEAGSCKVESWLSSASNTDFTAVANPSCVVNPFKPVELSMLTSRARSDGEWGTTMQPKAKMNIVPTGVGKLGFSFYAGGWFDALTGENLIGLCRDPRDVPAERDHAHQCQRRLAVGPPRRSALSALRHRLRLEVHRHLAVDHRSVWPGRPIRHAERRPAAVSDRRALPARRDFFGRSDLRPQHIRRERQLDHARHHDPLPGARRQAGAPSHGPSVGAAHADCRGIEDHGTQGARPGSIFTERSEDPGPPQLFLG